MSDHLEPNKRIEEWTELDDDSDIICVSSQNGQKGQKDDSSTIIPEEPTMSKCSRRNSDFLEDLIRQPPMEPLLSSKEMDEIIKKNREDTKSSQTSAEKKSKRRKRRSAEKDSPIQIKIELPTNDSTEANSKNPGALCVCSNSDPSENYSGGSASTPINKDPWQLDNSPNWQEQQQNIGNEEYVKDQAKPALSFNQYIDPLRLITPVAEYLDHNNIQLDDCTINNSNKAFYSVKEIILTNNIATNNNNNNNFIRNNTLGNRAIQTRKYSSLQHATLPNPDVIITLPIEQLMEDFPFDDLDLYNNQQHQFFF